MTPDWDGGLIIPLESKLDIIDRVVFSIASVISLDFLVWFHNYAIKQRERLAVDLDMIDELVLPLDATIVEYGSIPCVLTAALKERGYSILGIDLAPERFQPAIDIYDLNVLKCDIEKEITTLEDDFADLVLFNSLFEHLRINPIFTMKEAFRILKPGGKLMLTTPNLRSLRGIKNFLFRNLTTTNIYDQYERLEMGHMGHVREYTTREVTDFLERIGFRVEEIIYRGKYRNAVFNLLSGVFPSLKHQFTIILTKGHDDRPSI